MTSPGYESASPQPVPEMSAPPSTITDEERNRYGALLDAAAGRGLLSPAEYRDRIGQVADATSLAELQRLVTELPAFDRVGSTATTTPSGRDLGRTASDGTPDLDAVLWAGRTPAVGRRNRNNQWVVLAIIVGVLLVGLIALGLVAAHLAHNHSAGTAAVMVGRLSSLRL